LAIHGRLLLERTGERALHETIADATAGDVRAFPLI
jgi:hypothetical protein